MDQPNIVIEGQKALLRSLRKIDAELPAEIKAMNKEAADTVASAARSLVPRRTGTLERTIRAAGTNRFGIVRAGNNTKVAYGAPVHWGWARRHIKPQPFLYEALDARSAEVVRNYEQQLDALLDRVMGGVD